MFLIKKPEYPSLPEPPTSEELLEDLKVAGPDDIVFTSDIIGLDIENYTQGYPVLAGRFQALSFIKFEPHEDNISDHVSNDNHFLNKSFFMIYRPTLKLQSKLLSRNLPTQIYCTKK